MSDVKRTEIWGCSRRNAKEMTLSFDTITITAAEVGFLQGGNKLFSMEITPSFETGGILVIKVAEGKTILTLGDVVTIVGGENDRSGRPVPTMPTGDAHHYPAV